MSEDIKNEKVEDENKDIENTVKIDSEVKEIIKKAIKSNKIKKEKIDEKFVKNEILEHVDFLKKLNEIDMISENHRIIFTDKNEQLLYTDGEFYIIDTLTNEKKKKLKKREAHDAYVEYFITYTLNPLIEKKNVEKLKNNIAKSDNKNKQKNEKSKTEVKKKIQKFMERKNSQKVVEVNEVDKTKNIKVKEDKSKEKEI